MKTDEVTARQDIADVVDRRLARLWRIVALATVSASAGVGGVLLVGPADTPAETLQPAPAVVCECVREQPVSVVECRLAADFAREAAAAVGVSESALEQVAKDVLGAPPVR